MFLNTAIFVLLHILKKKNYLGAITELYRTQKRKYLHKEERKKEYSQKKIKRAF